MKTLSKGGGQSAEGSAVCIAVHGGHRECAELEVPRTGVECGGGVRLALRAGVGVVSELAANSDFLAGEAVFPNSIRSLPEPLHGGDVGFHVVEGDAPMGNFFPLKQCHSHPPRAS